MSTGVDVDVLEAEPPERVLADLQSGSGGLSARAADRRLLACGPNELSSRSRRTWPRALAAQFTHPLALLLVAAAALAFAGDIVILGWAILAVIILNAALAFPGAAGRARRGRDARVPAAAYHGDPRRPRAGGRGARAGPRDLMVVREGEGVCADAHEIDHADPTAGTARGVPLRYGGINVRPLSRPHDGLQWNVLAPATSAALVNVLIRPPCGASPCVP